MFAPALPAADSATRAAPLASPRSGPATHDSLQDQLPAPHRALRLCVVVPARNERAEIEASLRGLAEQTQADGSAFPPDAYEVILLANNCRDGTAQTARALARRWPRFRLRVAEVDFDPRQAHVGSARRLLMDTAAARLATVSGRAAGIIATTDADTVVSPRWLAQTCRAFAVPEVMAVGGYIFPRRESFQALDPRVQARGRHDLLYKMLAERLDARLDPNPCDPWPRHFFHNGASLAVRAAAYERVGGLPALAAHEDAEFHRRLCAADLGVRHDLRVRVATSARRHGRVPEGMSVTLQKWEADIRDGGRHYVEAPSAICQRAELRRRIRLLCQGERSAQNMAEELRRLAGEMEVELAAVRHAWTMGPGSRGSKTQRLLELSARARPAAFVPVEDAIAELRRSLA